VPVRLILYDQIRAGDYNMDGQVSVIDAVILSNIISGNVFLPQDVLLQAEPMKEGITDLLDLITLTNFLAGNIPSLPVIPSP
jgi:hypothetical protein